MNLQIKNNQKIVKIDKRKIRRVLKTVMNHLGCSDKYISVSFVNDDEIRVLNKHYLGKDSPTNVLSFSMRENDYGDINPNVLGDIVISAQTAKKDSLKGGLTVNQEIDFLLIHGLLHLLGFDHEKTTKDKANKMKQKEKELFYLLYPKTCI
ncbi:MAG: rRNA maturation RNase YbeY [Syntrophaceae bacterium]|nr:rRNA maturation RNase YbeY [Syntrophaceae bacterium]